MSQTDQDLVVLFGTHEPPPESRHYQTGQLDFNFTAGEVRHVRYRGVEVIRGIGYLLRDGNWASPALELGEIRVTAEARQIDIAFPARIDDGAVVFDIAATLTATADGLLEFAATGTAGSDFLANRIGFSLLHPAPQCENLPLTVEHLQGGTEDSRFPGRISPSQPVFDIRALRYTLGPVEVSCTMSSLLPDGSYQPFEMEDQRNWSDASFKTYVGSLLAPLPFAVKTGDVFRQTVTLRCKAGTMAQRSATPAPDRSSGELCLGEADPSLLPPFGLAVDRGLAGAALADAERLQPLGPRHLCAYLTAPDPDDRELQALCQLSARLNAPLELEIELPCQTPPERELTQLAQRCTAAGLHPAAVLPCPAAYLQSYQPTAEWPDVPPLAEVYRAARQAFPRARVGGGMLSYFTELNRCWPPAESIDFVSHTLTPIVHAADDTTVMENLGTLSAMAATVRARLGGIEHRLGPTAISMRHNPYGAGTLPGGDRRLPMADADPRETALFGAAWALGLAAAATAAGLASVTLFAAAGPRAVLNPDGRPRPVFHVLRGLAGLAGRRLRPIEFDGLDNVAGVAVEHNGGSEIWLANLGAADRRLRLPGRAEVLLLDAGSAAAGRDPNRLSHAAAATDTLTLTAYAVARCRL